MADVQRTRAAILALFADNVTGQISPQDLRDFVVTLMEIEFVNPGDFWKKPSPAGVTTDKSGKGWIDYSQAIDSTCSFGWLMKLTPSGTWRPALLGSVGTTGLLGVALDSYVSGVSTAQILRRGLVKNSAWSALTIGQPAFLHSTSLGIFTQTVTAASRQVIGVAEGTDMLRFDPEWAVRTS